MFDLLDDEPRGIYHHQFDHHHYNYHYRHDYMRLLFSCSDEVTTAIVSAIIITLAPFLSSSWYHFYYLLHNIIHQKIYIFFFFSFCLNHPHYRFNQIYPHRDLQHHTPLSSTQLSHNHHHSIYQHHPRFSWGMRQRFISQRRRFCLVLAFVPKLLSDHLPLRGKGQVSFYLWCKYSENYIDCV